MIPLSKKEKKTLKFFGGLVPVLGEYMAYEEMKKHNRNSSLSNLYLAMAAILRPLLLYDMIKNPNPEELLTPIIFYSGFTFATETCIFEEDLYKTLDKDIPLKCEKEVNDFKL